MTPQLADITSSNLFDVANFVFKFSYWFMTMDTQKCDFWEYQFWANLVQKIRIVNLS